MRAVGQALTLTSAADTARELVALWLDVPTDEVQAVLDYSRIDPEAVELAAGARSEQARAEELSRGAAKRLRQAARRLVHIDGLSLRDAAAVLGVAFGRVQQLLKDRPAKTRAAAVICTGSVTTGKSWSCPEGCTS